MFFEGPARVDLVFLGLLLALASYFLSLKLASKAVASVGGNMMPIRTWSLAVWMWFGIQYFANVLRPPSVGQVLLLGVATAAVRAAALIVALGSAHRVTAAADVSLRSFHQVKRLDS